MSIKVTVPNAPPPPNSQVNVFSYFATRDNLEHLESEFNYWFTNHMVSFEHDGEVYNMFRYKCNSDGPRCQCYKSSTSLVCGLVKISYNSGAITIIIIAVSITI